MRHIIKYNIFEGVDSQKIDQMDLMKSDIEDILIDVRDEGFTINIDVNKYYKNRMSRGFKRGSRMISEVRYGMMITIAKRIETEQQVNPGNWGHDDDDYDDEHEIMHEYDDPQSNTQKVGTYNINIIKDPLTHLDNYIKMSGNYDIFYIDFSNREWRIGSLFDPPKDFSYQDVLKFRIECTDLDTKSLTTN